MKTFKNIKAANVPELMKKAAGNAWMGIRPNTFTLKAGTNEIKIEGYTYEPFYEDFSATSSISLNGQCLFGVDSKNIAAYRNITVNIGKYETLEEAISHIENEIKNNSLVLCE